MYIVEIESLSVWEYPGTILYHTMSYHIIFLFIVMFILILILILIILLILIPTQVLI